MYIYYCGTLVMFLHNPIFRCIMLCVVWFRRNSYIQQNPTWPAERK